MIPVASEAMRAALKGADPSPDQWEAICAGLEPVAIVAGAGSGKTAVMTARIVYLVEAGLVPASGVLGLTFTNKAAGELEDRLTAALRAMDPPPGEVPTVMTYNAFAAQIAREHGPRIGIDADSGLLTLAQKWQMLLGLVDRLPTFEELELRHPLSFIPQTLELADQCANHLVSPEELEEACRQMLAQQLGDGQVAAAARKRAELAIIVRAYTEEKRRRRRIDFGDQICLAVRILEAFPEVAAELRERYPVVLLDEYQDTNPAQKVLLQHLCPPGSAVTAVGDARQAIYGWRGASMFNLLHFDREFPRADGSPSVTLSLRENWRSGRRIVELANRLIAPVPPQRRPGRELVAVPHNGEGWVGAAVFCDQDAEAAFIAEEIERLHGQPKHDGSPRRWADVAILVRTRRYLDRIVSALEERDIPYEIPEVGGLLKVPAVVDVVAWLHVLSDRGPQTNRWLARILMGPRFRVHYRDLAPIARWAAERNRELDTETRQRSGLDDPDPGDVAFSLLEALSHLDAIEGISREARERIGEFCDLLATLRPATSGSLAELVQEVAERTGLLDALAASSARAAAAMRESLQAFFALCSEFSPLEGEPTLEAFLEYLDTAEEAEDPIPLAATAASDSVKVLTVHAAKGLEFDTVFLPVIAAAPEADPYDGTRKRSVFPDLRTADPLTSVRQLPPDVRRDADDLPRYRGNRNAYRRALKERAEEDERRLLYVAVTRARQRLYCTAAHWYEPEERKGPSPFLRRLACDGPNAPPGVMDHTDLVEVLRDDPCPGASPLVAQRQLALAWPRQPGCLDAEAMAWVARVEGLVDGSLSEDQVLSGGGPEAATLLRAHERQIRALSEETAAADGGGSLTSLPATRAAELLGGRAEPSDLAWPLPSRPSEARRLGIEVHAWIEEVGRGLLGLADEDAASEPSGLVPDELVDRLKANFAAMGFAGRRLLRLDTGEPMAEVPFVLKLGGVLVRGRVDAVYEGPEVVDFKTGAEPEEVDWSQLELYAEALAELGYLRGPVRLTYAFLATATSRSKDYEPRGLDALAERLEAALRPAG